MSKRLLVAWLAAVLPACSHGGGAKTASDAAQQSPAFSLEPGRPEDQFELAKRYESGNGVEADDAWAEYWAFRAALQGHAPARDWLHKRAYMEPIDQPAVLVIDVLNHAKPRAYPSSQLWLLLAGPGSSVTPDTRREAGDLVREGLPVMREKALRGNVWAKYLVGAVSDALRDSAEAVRWYTEAAELGNVLAQDSLGHMYEDGRGTASDAAQAKRWFQAAADQGYAPSESMIGWIYDKGRGVPENPTESARWYLKAAQQGMPFAQNRLGSLYANGRGVARDEGEARRWFRAAAEGGSAEAAENLRALEGRSPDVEANSSPASLAKAAVGGNAQAQYRLAVMYDLGQGQNKNAAEAARWYTRAAEQNHHEAQLRLSKLYELGQGVPKDPAKAREWSERGARGGDDAKKP